MESKKAGKYVLAVEGSVPTKDGGVYCTVGGMTAIDYLHKAAAAPGRDRGRLLLFVRLCHHPTPIRPAASRFTS